MKLTRIVFLGAAIAGAVAACVSDSDPAANPSVDLDAGLDANVDGTVHDASGESSPGQDSSAIDAGVSDAADGAIADAQTGDALPGDAQAGDADASEAGPFAAGCITGIFPDHYIRADGRVRNSSAEIKLLAPDGGVGAALEGAVEGAAGSGFACARLADQTVRCWSVNNNAGSSSGRLGDGTATYPVPANAATQVLVATGADAGGPPVPLTDATKLMRDSQPFYGGTTCAIRADKTAWCWGTVVSTFGGIRIITSAPSNSPALVAMPIVKQDGSPLQNVEEITMGMRHACAITSDVTPRDSVYCWGANIYNEVGDTLPDASSAVSRLFPVKITRIPAGTVRDIGARNEGTCVIVDDKTYCWGDNSYGTAGTGAPTVVQPGCSHVCENRDPAPPVLLGPPTGAPEAGVPLTDLTRLHTGYFFACGVSPTDQLYCWGNGPSPASMAGLYPDDAGTLQVKFLTSVGSSGYKGGLQYVTPDGGWFASGGGNQRAVVCP